MASLDRKLANAVGAKSARACDNCVRKRARLYCAADDAFLCQSCDSSVHSANPLARRHERVRLKTASIKSIDVTSIPSWHKGFTKKARTPRQKKHAKPEHLDKINNPFYLVPEICSEENSHDDENEEQLLYRVPILDPFVAELCNSNEAVYNTEKHDFSQEMNHLNGFLDPSEMDLADFAADVESLLGKGLEDESFDMEGLGLLDCDGKERVKVEDEEIGEVGNNIPIDAEFIDLGRETFELNFDYDSPVTGEEEDEVKLVHNGELNLMNNFDGFNQVVDESKKKIFLRLDYEGVLSAWDEEKSPWTNGERPELDSGDCWPDCMGTCGTMHVYGGEMGMVNRHSAATMADGGREARVSRYREKRRTRLFSKKIRYEVRKLNAEKRPRMKGRFVKRANLVSPLINK
ncbi:hypothetical protein ACJIZ3_019717 [Penstemon smallii]|uniref:Uncharacterized protein n=1 Tax=Penstemon smallii TaxID=265156 RepID=A0ABD3T204_9LAMI